MTIVNEHTVLLSLEYTQLTSHQHKPLHETNNGLWTPLAGSTSSTISNLAPIKQCAANINSTARQGESVQIVDPHLANPDIITVCIKGTTGFINHARTEILTSYNQTNFKKITMDQSDFIKVNDYFLSKLTELSQYYSVEMLVSNINTDFGSKWHLSRENSYSIYILGNQDNITVAETQVRILMDTVLNGYVVDSVSLPLSLIPIVGGVDLLNFNEIVKQSLSNVYLPDLLPELFNSKMLSQNRDLRIWITGESVYEVIMTKKILTDLVDSVINRQHSLIVKEVTINKSKLDLLILYNQSAILNIMFKYGTFIQLPSLGELHNYSLQVQGQSPECVNDSIRDLSALCSQLYTLELLPITNQATNLMNDLFLTSLMQQQRSLVVTYNLIGGLTITGDQQEIKLLISQLIKNESSFIQSTHFEVNLVLELNVQQKDFISGKKNGKIIKILNQLSQIPMISFHNFNEYNFFIKISITTGNDRFANILKSIELVELELPAELQFNVPEVFHKSIIGNGGSIIQSIMKKYNVFIKFSSTVISAHDESIFYSFKRFDNVLIKCPMKNAKNIMLVKYEIDQLVTQCCLNSIPTTNKSINTTIYQTVEFTLLKSHYLMMINKNYNLKFINMLEIENNSFIDFPRSIDEFGNADSLRVLIKGSDLKSKQCATKLSGFLPRNFEFKIPFCHGKFEEMISLTNKEFKENIVIPFRLMLGVEVMINENCLDNQTSGDSDCHQILLSYYGKESDERIQMAINDLTLYLREKKFLILDKQSYKFNPIKQQRSSLAGQNVLKPITNKVANHNNNTKPVRSVPFNNFPIAQQPQQQYISYMAPIENVAMAAPFSSMAMVMPSMANGGSIRSPMIDAGVAGIGGDAIIAGSNGLASFIR